MATLEERQQAFLSARADLQTVLRAFNEGNKQTLDYLAVRMEQHSQHRETIGNPHNLTKAHFNLGNIVNRPLASLVDIDNLSNPERYLTPFTFKRLVEKLTSEGDVLTNPIRNPVPTAPINNATTPTQGTVLAADTYRNVYNTFTEQGAKYFPRKYRHFQVDDFNGDFSSPIWERYVEDQDFATVNMTLPMDTPLKWRCRDITVDDLESNWSATGLFRTAQYVVVPPTIDVEGHPGRVPDKPFIRASDFEKTGTDAQHTATGFKLFLAGGTDPIWEKTNVSGNMNEVWLPEYLLEPNTRYRVEITHHSDLLASATSVPLTFRTANQFIFEPGKRWLNWGNEEAGIYDEVPQSQFITTGELLTKTGLSGGTATGWADTSPWLKIVVDGVVMYTPKQPLRTNVNRSILVGLGLINGKTIQIGDWEYTVRLMNAIAPGETAADLSDIAAMMPEKADGSEYDKIFKMLTIHGTGQYSNGDLGFSPSTRYVLMREPGVLPSHGAVRMGNTGNVTEEDVFSIAHMSSSEFQNVSWRPALIRGESLEVVEPEPELPPFVAYDSATDTGYLGVIPATELFTGPELSAEVGLSSGTAFNNEVDWLGFYVGPNATCNKEGGVPYLVYVPQRPHRYNLSWDHINAAGVARGDVKTVSKGGHTYKVRLLSGGNNRKVESGYPGTGYHHPGGPMESEWNQLIYRVHSMVPNGTEFVSGGPQVGDNWANFTDAELGVNYQVSPNGNAIWCTEDWFENSSFRVHRGYYSVAYVDELTSSSVDTRYGWRSALVAVPD